MKKELANYIFIIFSFLALSCSENSNEPENDKNEVIDDYMLLAATDSGGIYKIGNNTGNVEKTGQIDGINFQISINTITSSIDKIYSVELVYNPSPTNNLFVFDKSTNTSEFISLEIPESINGNEQAIIAMTYDGENLIGILVEDALKPNSIKHVVIINPQNFEMTDTGVSFNEDYIITSINVLSDKLFLSTWDKGLYEIDILNNTINSIDFDGIQLNGSRMAIIDNSRIALMNNLGPGYFNTAKPVELNLSDKTIIEKSNGDIYGLVSIVGNTIYKDGTYLNLVSTSELYFAILKCNYITEKNKLIEVELNDISRNMIVVGVIN